MKPLVRRSLLLLLLLALPLGRAAALVEVEPLDGGTRYRVTFKHTPVIGSQSVSVAGDWNGWDKA